jgi:hypothetical protein
MSTIALGVATLNRTNRLEKLLSSVCLTPVERVYVADNGRMSEQKERLYERDYAFDLTVYDLEYDIGLGYCRNHIANNFEEDYLLVADDDHVLNEDIIRLQKVLETEESIGGVAGTIMEPENDRVRQSAKDFKERNGHLYRGADINDKQIDLISNNPFVEFDFIPYPTLYKRECIQGYRWDPQFEIGRAHIDFYLTHWHETDWSFGICPNVFFEHYPGGDATYTDHRKDDEKYERSFRRFDEKWGYETVEMGKSHWFDSAQTISSVSDRIAEVVDYNGMTGLINGAYVVGKNLLRGR